MDRRTIVGLVAAMIALQLYFYFFMKPPAAVDSDAVAEGAPADPANPAPTPPGGPVASAPAADPEASIPVTSIDRNWCSIKSTMTTEGGAFRGVQDTDYTADYHVTAWWQWIYGRVWSGTETGAWKPYSDSGPAVLLTADANGLIVGAGDTTSKPPRVQISEQTDDKIVLTGTAANGIEIVRSIGVTPDCMLDMTVSWKNTSAVPWAGSAWIGIFDSLPTDYGQYVSSMRPVGSVNGKVGRWTDLTALDTPQTSATGPVEWFGMHDKFFAFAVIPDPGHDGTLIYSRRAAGSAAGTIPEYGVYYTEAVSLAPSASEIRHFRVFAGSTEISTLNAIDPNLSSIVNLGWFGFFAKIMLWVLVRVHSLVQNWGIAIMGVTLLLKLVTLPLTQMAFKSGQAMQAAQPELAKVREQYADNPEEMNRQTMAVMSKHGANPATGCLPMLIQLPIWVALATVLTSCPELYHAQFLWLRDLSSPDPYGVLPAVVMATSLLQQRAMPMTGMDPDQARMMKALPIVFGVMYFWFPSGLVLYIFVNMVLTMAQQWVVKRQFGATAAATPPAI